jgi:photosystem II stability/assembly factor-like uncharacterized protein
LAAAGTAPLARAAAQRWQLWACMVNSRDWVVGSKLPASGLMVRTAAGWEQRGFNHPLMMGVDWDGRDAAVVFLAAGNGVIRAAEGGRKWKILSDHRITELRDIAVDREKAGTIYAAHTAGLAVTRDAGATWANLTPDEKRPFVEAVRIDRAASARLVAGGERGLFLSEDAGKKWRCAGAAGLQIMHLEQSPHEADDWIAVTMKSGALRSRDGARTWEHVNEKRVGYNLGADRNLYDVAFDPTTKGRIALAGFGPGVYVTEDDGANWQVRSVGLPRWDVWSVAFDPGSPGRLYASVHEEAVFVSNDAGRHWEREGLEGSAVYRFRFIPEVAP